MRRPFAVLMMSVMLTCAARAVIPVTDYNWLQLEPERVVPTVGAVGAASLNAGYGNVSVFRWGDRYWIPSVYTNNGTMFGNRDYWAQLKLDEARNVKNVYVQWWANETTSLSNFYVQGSIDGVNFTTIGSKDYGLFKTGDWRENVDVTDGNYQYIRVLVKAGEYTHRDPGLGGDRGGPGLYTIEPVGDGSFDPWKGQALINWANKDVFGTTLEISGLDFPGLGYNDGWLYDRGSPRTGDTSPWEAEDYAQIDLQAVRPIDRVVVVWEYMWDASSYDIQYSSDGVNFTPVTGKSAPVFYGYDGGATAYTFDPIGARYVRITDGIGNSYGIFNQVLVFGPLPEPSTILLLSLGGLVLFWRRRR